MNMAHESDIPDNANNATVLPKWMKKVLALLAGTPMPAEPPGQCMEETWQGRCKYRAGYEGRCWGMLNAMGPSFGARGGRLK